MLSLRIESSEGVRRIDLGDESLVIGRGEKADITLPEPKASRRHVLLTPQAGGVVVRDLGSTNGTWRGTTRIDQARIGPGEAFRIGDSMFVLLAEAPATVRRRSGIGKPLLGALLPALLLFVLVELAASAAGSSRQSEIDAAAQKLDAARYGMARIPAETSPRDPVAELDALNTFLEAYPDSRHAEDAREQARILAPEVGRIRRARADLAELAEMREAGALPFAELYFRYENLLERTSDLPDVAAQIRTELHSLDSSSQEKLRALVSGVMSEATDLSARGEYGRAASLLGGFGKRNPSAAAKWEEALGKAEAEVNKRALYAYRDLLTRSTEMIDGGKADEGVGLLRREAVRFTGTRFRALLLSRADALASRADGASGSGRAAAEVARRRSYDLLAAEAEELASAGFFLRAADKYAGILPEVAIPPVRDEFTVRERELRGLHELIERVKDHVRTVGPKFGTVRFGETRYKVLGMEGDTLRLGFRRSEVSRAWGAFTPDEELAILRSAKLTPAERQLLAVYCFYLSLRTDYEAEIIEGLTHEETRETAGRLYARKEGRPYPNGGFLPYRGRILTREEHAEEIHKELLTALRNRQTELYDKLVDHPAFARLRKLGELRRELDKARQYALALIFDEVKYFYPYRNRMKEYQPVQREVDIRVAAVRVLWGRPAKVTVKVDSAMKRLAKEIDDVNAELARIGVDTTEFKRAVARVTLYVDKPLTIRNYFHNPVEHQFHEYNRRVMEWNERTPTEARELEKKQVRITNEYRIMLGRRALVIDDRLVRSARGHCEEMGRLGYFSHFSPIPERRTPDLRAKIEGYKGSAVSENIHRGRGTPEGAHNGWTHSSGHHRNLLRRFWTEMGTGQTGNIWTQNFGRTKPKVFDTQTEEDK